ncbi:MAG TPA: L-erythro-3,5-diaminohexanoate dehydrogenase [Polyangiaceae bacterium]|nr:L-erythro-3,5-diaminohexanoate dehydrogenase [Polyangiaceae bacterium]
MTPTLGDPFGTHRVVEPAGALPQPAWRLDNDPSHRFETEIHVAVATLNVDAASFRQMEAVAGTDDGALAQIVRDTVRARGKQHNPVTGSGGMLLGRVAWIGTHAQERGFSLGDRVATLASLSLTPLTLSSLGPIRRESGQIDVEGTAIVFASAPLVKMPADLPDRLALAVCDVAGAAPQIARRARAGGSVVVLGAGGKSGLLCCVEARRRTGAGGLVVGVESHEPFARDLEALGVCDEVIRADARDPMGVRWAVLKATRGSEADLVVSCVNVEGVEASAILITRPRGQIVFFAMSTSFTRAALGAEGIGKDIDMYIGNGYAEGHAEHTLELVRGSASLRRLLEARYA